MMQEREKLLRCVKQGIANHHKNDRQYLSDSIVDELIADGVIAPPCKVGDVMYVNPETWGGLSFIHYDHCFIYSKHFLAAEVVSIVKNRKQNLIKLKVYNMTTYTPEYRRYPISSIGKTVFRTREEVEKALKGGAE